MFSTQLWVLIVLLSVVFAISFVLIKVGTFIFAYIGMKYGYGQTTEVYVPSDTKYLWRKTFTKRFHIDYFSPVHCWDGSLKFGTYYQVWENGYLTANSIRQPDPSNYKY